MKKSMEKDQKKRFAFLEMEASRRILKAILHNVSLPLSLRRKASLSLSILPKSSSVNQIKNRCFITGRGRFVLGWSHMSRLTIRKLAREGLMPGLQKSSW